MKKTVSSTSIRPGACAFSVFVAAQFPVFLNYIIFFILFGVASAEAFNASAHAGRDPAWAFIAPVFVRKKIGI
ncbi:MAG: hypothetical protein LBD44_04010 [Spirochaetaceae bacterium]|nr:hypothetical protein [Spirochaetaceae bacterium]